MKKGHSTLHKCFFIGITGLQNAFIGQDTLPADRTTCIELTTCANLATWCHIPGVAAMCKNTCKIDPCGSDAATDAPITVPADTTT